MYYISMYTCIYIYIQNTYLIYTVYIHLYIYIYVGLLVLFKIHIYTHTASNRLVMKSTPSQDGSGQLEPSELIDGFLTWGPEQSGKQV